MNELIDRDKFHTLLIHRAEELRGMNGSLSGACSGMAKLLLTQPTIEIIHCKECKFATMTVNGECKYCDIWFPDEKTYMDGDYFCASAERRTNDG